MGSTLNKNPVFNKGCAYFEIDFNDNYLNENKSLLGALCNTPPGFMGPTLSKSLAQLTLQKVNVFKEAKDTLLRNQASCSQPNFSAQTNIPAKDAPPLFIKEQDLAAAVNEAVENMVNSYKQQIAILEEQISELII